MDNDKKIPEAVIRRMPKYYRYLVEIEKTGENKISSSRMSRDMGLNASQIRRDLNCFGGFGQQGYGYSVKKLKEEIAHILGLDKQYNVIIIGAGNMCKALIRYKYFKEQGFLINAVFDSNESKVGTVLEGTKIMSYDSMGEYISQNNVDIAVIATPQIAAQQVANKLVELGVKALWNFAPIDVAVPEGVAVENVHLSDSLYVLCYRDNSR